MKSMKVTTLLITLTCALVFDVKARYVIEENSDAVQFDREYSNYKEKVQNDQFAKNYEQNLEIHSLKRELASVAKSYTSKAEYLETELQKTKAKLIETAVASNKKEEYYSQKYKAENEALKTELVLKNKIIAEYQRELEKIKSDKGYKELAKQNLELASQLRNFNQKTIEDASADQPRRMPASVNP